MKVAEIKLKGSSGSLIVHSFNFEDLDPLDEHEIGEELTIKIIDMPEEKYKNLQEFDGW